MLFYCDVFNLKGVNGMKLKSKLMALVIGATMGLMPVLNTANAADSTASAHASENLSAASGTVVSGSVGVLAASGELIVVGVERSARGVSVVVKNVADASGEVATVLLDGAAAASVAVGSVLKASATGVGYVLVAAGKAIAFIPNEIGQSLLHQSSYTR
jgi:hypothetical protein